MLTRRSFVFTAIACAPATELLAQLHPTGHYIGQLILRPLSSGRLMELQEPYAYIDTRNQRWNVPSKAIVDGASIPAIFWPVIGGPWDGPYRNASVVHDWFCAVRTMPWKQVHRMFYDAMLTSGVSPNLARLMFLAVFYAGPSWDDLTIRDARLLTRNGAVRLDPPGVRPASNGFSSEGEETEARHALISKFRRLSAEVKRNNLSPEDIESLVEQNGRDEEVAVMLVP